MGAGESDDSEERPAGKKAKAATPVANGTKRKEVKSEPVPDEDQDQGQGSEAEVRFFD